MLERRADAINATPEQVAEAILRSELDNSVHIEQRLTAYGLQAYVRGTRVAVRHVASFVRAGHTAEEIITEGLPHLPPAAIHEAIAYYYDYRDEIEDELGQETPDAVYAILREQLSPEQFYQLTGQPAR